MMVKKADDDGLAELEAELKALEALGSDSSYGSPAQPDKESQYKFFREILNFVKSWKVGNLKDDEIGRTKLTVRSYLELARYSNAEGLDLVQGYFLDKANIVAEPTMGRKGFFAQLIVTSIKKEDKGEEKPKPKKSWFGRGGIENE